MGLLGHGKCADLYNKEGNGKQKASEKDYHHVTVWSKYFRSILQSAVRHSRPSLLGVADSNLHLIPATRPTPRAPNQIPAGSVPSATLTPEGAERSRRVATTAPDGAMAQGLRRYRQAQRKRAAPAAPAAEAAAAAADRGSVTALDQHGSSDRPAVENLQRNGRSARTLVTNYLARESDDYDHG